MHYGGIPTLPVAATFEGPVRLPPFQQIIVNPTIIASLILLGIALVVIIFLAFRAKMRAKWESRQDALRMAERILLKRGGEQDDVSRVKYVFDSNRAIDVAATVMVKESFLSMLRPHLAKLYGDEFADRIEKFYFPPPKDTRKALGVGAPQDLKELVEERRSVASTQASAALLDLMDATLRPGVVVKLIFSGIEGGYECMVMGHDMQYINVTLPANNNLLVAALQPGLPVEGSLESGPSLMAFTAEVVQAVAGSMPYCRLTAWKTAWEVRTREAVRLPISIDIDFHHISTAATNAVRLSNIDKELGAIRPGKLIDISLGGCCIETPSASVFNVGDMLRFSKSLVTGNPPATLLGAIVHTEGIDPEEHDGCRQRLHVQFLVIDDVSQRILVRTMRQLQDVMAREEWMQAQQLLQRMRRNKLENYGTSPGGAGGTGSRRTGAHPKAKPSTRITLATHGGQGTGRKQSTRSFPKIPGRNGE